MDEKYTASREQGVENKNDAYAELINKRQRPDLPADQIIEENMPMDDKIEILNQKIFSFEEALEATTKYFGGDVMAAKVWINKYALKNSNGELFEKTPDDMHRRIASEIARIESRYPNPLSEDEIFEVLKDFKYIVPQGSPMAGIGNDFQISSLSNCFVIGSNGPSDSYGGILKVDQEQVQLMKRRGGVGHDLSHIRPTGSPVKNSALTSTGIVPFMERYSNSTREVAQDGRRGALMLSISIKHPDAENFIDAKLQEGKVTGANVSVKIDHEFMEAVKSDAIYKQQYPINSSNPVFVKEIKAKPLWDKIIHNAWKSAEPGILFWDTIINESVPDCYADMGFTTVSTNPCGEIPLCPYDSCRLLALNLYNYVEKPFTDEAYFDSDLFSKHIHYAQRIMDDIIDLEIEKIDRIIEKINSDPEDEDTKSIEKNLWLKIREKTLQGRRTGIGITAEGDMLAALGCRYGSESATNFSVEVHKQLALDAYSASVNLAKERGAFPVYNAEKEANNPFIQRIKEFAPNTYTAMTTYGRRNIALLTIAPTGSVSICTQTTSGIEPAFKISYKRRRKVNPNDQQVKVSFTDEQGDSWEEFHVFHPKFFKWLEVNNYDIEKTIKLSDDELKRIIEKSPYYKATANDIDWLAKVKMQGAIQKWVDHSISVTVNVPNNVSEELVSEIYQTAWESGCKGVTIYRDGSRDGVLISDTAKKDETNEFRETDAPKRPVKLEATVVRFQNDYDKWLAVIGNYNKKPYEIFTGKADDFFIPPFVNEGWVIKSKDSEGVTRYDFQYADKLGYKTTMEGLSRSFNSEFWNYAKLISGILRHGMPLVYVIELVSNLQLDSDSINAWKNGVVRALKKYVPDGTVSRDHECPACHQTALVYKEGCLTCENCGHSKC